MGTEVYNNLPEFIKEIDDYKAFKKELKLFLLCHSFLLTGRICIFSAINLRYLSDFSTQNINGQFMNYLLNTI